jgi:glycosyltransferase involved in cell wall biosynthesis
VESTGNRITLVNLQENKGVRLFAGLCDRLDEFQFLGVEGTHGEQEIEHFRYLPNFNRHPVTQDMREVWRESKIVLMPSEYESYGMVAAEAAINGIPVIAHPTPGLVECLGGAGIFIDRSDTDGYERAIRLLMTDPQSYAERSGMARYRGQELVKQTERELKRFVNRLRKMVRP